MGTLTRLPTPSRPPTVTTSTDASGAIIVRIEATSTLPPDDLVDLAKSGLEGRAWRALVRSGELPARKIGRRWMTTRSALCRLVLEAPKPPASDDPTDAYAALLAKRGAR